MKLKIEQLEYQLRIPILEGIQRDRSQLVQLTRRVKRHRRMANEIERLFVCHCGK